LWTSLFAAAVKQGKRFVLYSGDSACLLDAQRLGVAAFMKPTEASILYRAVVEQESEVRSQESGQAPNPDPQSLTPESDATGEP